MSMKLICPPLCSSKKSGSIPHRSFSCDTALAYHLQLQLLFVLNANEWSIFLIIGNIEHYVWYDI